MLPCEISSYFFKLASWFWSRSLSSCFRPSSCLLSRDFPLESPNISVKPNLLYLLPYEIWDSVLEMSEARSKSTVSFWRPWGLPYCWLKLFSADSVRMKSRLSGLYLTGLLKTRLHDLSCWIEGPSESVPWFLYSLRRLFQRSCFDRTLAFPKMIRPYLALVRATLSLLGSLRKPMPEASLDLTQEKRIKSFSLPWKLSTDATSISL